MKQGADTGWEDLREPHERLRWARVHWQRQRGGAETAVAAAESLGLKIGTYSAYEREPGSSKHTPLNHQRAIEFARKFKVNWIWLLRGTGTPFDDGMPAEGPLDRILRAMQDQPAETQETVADMVERLFKKAG